MMFLNQKGNCIYKVTLSIDKVFEPFWSLSKNLIGVKLLEKIYSVFNGEFQNTLAERLKKCDEEFQKKSDAFKGSKEEKQRFIDLEGNSKYDTVFSEAFNIVTESYLKQILSADCFSKGIKKSCSLVIYHPSGVCYFVREGDASLTFVDDFCKCLYKSKILPNFLQFLDDNIANAYTFDKNIYLNALPDNPFDDAVSITSPLYHSTLVSAKAGVEKIESDFKIWYNEPVLKKYDYDMPHEGVVYEFRQGDTLLALEQGECFIPIGVDWRNYFDITNQLGFVWTDYKNNVFVKPYKEGEKRIPQKKGLTQQEQSFIDAAKSDIFTMLLSYLVDNLYLSNDAPEINAEYKKFFQTLVKIEDLKHLPDYKLYVPNQESETILGLYKVNKQRGETSFNLHHMLSLHKQGEECMIKDCYDQEQRKIDAVEVLIPQYAIFYMQYYYEFFVGEVLKDLKDSGVIKDYIRNIHYAYKTAKGVRQCEIDAIVNTGRKIVLVELKTTLHVEHLTDYPHRCASMIQGSKVPELYDFYFISSFADDNIKVLQNEEKEGYNKRREGLKSIPYKFDVAIPGTEKKLHCLSESSFEKLKAELQRVFTV